MISIEQRKRRKLNLNNFVYYYNALSRRVITRYAEGACRKKARNEIIIHKREK